jgi:putative peptidoglycan lipid II flippase
MRTAAKTAALMAALTLGSKLMGFLREIFMANFFGTSFITDSYVMATSIPGILFAGVFASISVAYMPLLSKIVEEEGIQEGNRFTSDAIKLTMTVATVSAVLGFFFSDALVSVFARGFSGETAELTSFYVKITFSFVIFTGITGLLTAYQNYRGSFLRPIIAGYFQSGSIVVFIIISAYTTHYLLAFGWLMGSALFTVVTVFFARKAGFSYKPGKKMGATAKHILMLSLPVFIGSSISQINTFVDKMLASGLPEGSVAALNYSHLLIGLITALSISVINTIIYPRLTQAVARGDMARFGSSVATGINIIVIIAVPFSLGAMLYSDTIVQIVYERGAFSASSTALTGPAFFFYAIGLTFTALNSLLVHAYYAMHDMRTPVVCSVLGALTNITLNLLLISRLQHRGLAMATSVAAIVSTVLLASLLRRKHPEVQALESVKKIGQILLSALFAVAASWPVYSALLGIGGLRTEILPLVAAVSCAGILYLLLLKMFKISELSLLTTIVKFK